MYGCESWTIKIAECQRIDAFELWCWRRLLRVPWTSRWSNQSILKEISPEIFTGRTNAEAETLATWCKELTHWKRPWCWERLKAGEEGEDRGWDGWMASPTQWTWVWASFGSWWWTGRPGVLQSMGSQRVRYDWLNRTIGIIYSSQKVYLSPHSSQQNLAPNFLWLFPKPKSTFRGWEFAIVEFQPLQDTDRDSLSVEGDPSGWLLDIWDSLNFHLISP